VHAGSDDSGAPPATGRLSPTLETPAQIFVQAAARVGQLHSQRLRGVRGAAERVGARRQQRAALAQGYEHWEANQKRQRKTNTLR